MTAGWLRQVEVDHGLDLRAPGALARWDRSIASRPAPSTAREWVAAARRRARRLSAEAFLDLDPRVQALGWTRSRMRDWVEGGEAVAFEAWQRQAWGCKRDGEPRPIGSCQAPMGLDAALDAWRAGYPARVVRVLGPALLSGRERLPSWRCARVRRQVRLAYRAATRDSLRTFRVAATLSALAELGRVSPEAQTLCLMLSVDTEHSRWHQRLVDEASQDPTSVVAAALAAARCSRPETWRPLRRRDLRWDRVHELMHGGPLPWVLARHALAAGRRQRQLLDSQAVREAMARMVGPSLAIPLGAEAPCAP